MAGGPLQELGDMYIAIEYFTGTLELLSALQRLTISSKLVYRTKLQMILGVCVPTLVGNRRGIFWFIGTSCAT